MARHSYLTFNARATGESENDNRFKTANMAGKKRVRNLLAFDARATRRIKVRIMTASASGPHYIVSSKTQLLDRVTC